LRDDKGAKVTLMLLRNKIKANLKAAGVNENDIIFIDTTEISKASREAHCATNAERKPPD